MGGGVKDEGVSPDDPGRRGAGIGTGLRSGRGAGMATMSGPGLPLAPPPEVTAAGDDDAQDNHGQNREDDRGYARPVEIDEGYTIDGLVNGCLLMGGL